MVGSASPRLERINVIGNTGSGKSTLARTLADRLAIPHIELDALFWEPGWVQAPVEVFRARLADAIAANCWVVDGNYDSTARDLLWSRAETIIWLDYPLPLILWRLTRRTFRRLVLREKLWNGNRESFSGVLFSRKSLFLWAIQTHGKKRRIIPARLSQPENARLAVLRFSRPRDAERWLATVPRYRTDGFCLDRKEA